MTVMVKYCNNTVYIIHIHKVSGKIKTETLISERVFAEESSQSTLQKKHNSKTTYSSLLSDESDEFTLQPINFSEHVGEQSPKKSLSVLPGKTQIETVDNSISIIRNDISHDDHVTEQSSVPSKDGEIRTFFSRVRAKNKCKCKDSWDKELFLLKKKREEKKIAVLEIIKQKELEDLRGKQLENMIKEKKLKMSEDT